MKLVIALGGNALLRRGQVLSAENQLANIRRAASQIARVAALHDIVLTHGNGPQVGLLALQAEAFKDVDAYPLDVLGAQTEGMIGYMLEQELTNLLPVTRLVSTLLTRVEVAADDPAFAHPTKPIGPMYTQAEATTLAATKHWTIAPDEKGFRRVVASPKPIGVIGQQSIEWLLQHHVLVIAAGGGGIPVTRRADKRTLVGVEAVIDKDLCAGLLATALHADFLVIATDVAGVFLDWGLATQHAIGRISPEALARHQFAAGSMAPKVEAACKFVTATGKPAIIGSLEEIESMIAGTAGTVVCIDGADAV